MNAELSVTVAASGTYIIQVLAESGSGEYVLHVETSPSLPLQFQEAFVTSSSSSPLVVPAAKYPWLTENGSNGLSVAEPQSRNAVPPSIRWLTRDADQYAAISPRIAKPRVSHLAGMTHRQELMTANFAAILQTSANRALDNQHAGQFRRDHSRMADEVMMSWSEEDRIEDQFESMWDELAASRRAIYARPVASSAGTVLSTAHGVRTD